MSGLLRTSDLQPGDAVRCVGGRYDGRMFLISAANGTPSIGLVVLTKDGRRDRRHLGWSGWYDDCEWDLVSRKGEGGPETTPRPGP